MKRAFTLIELLVVITIIGALTGIAVPLTMAMVSKSREAACLANLRDMGVGLQLYLQDSNNQMPTLAMGRTSKDEDIPVIETLLAGYLDSDRIFECPADHVEFDKTGCSYHWNVTQNGKYVSQLSFFGIDEERSGSVPLISDKESWHKGGTNFLYADFSASDKTRFVTGGEE